MFNNNSNGPLFCLLLVCAWSVEAATTAAKKTAPPTPWWQVAAAGGAYFALYAIPITIFLVGATHFKRMWTHIHMHHEQRQNPIDMSAFRHWTTYPYAKHAQHALTTLMDHLRDTSFTYAPRLVPGPGAEVHSVLWTDVEFVQGPKKNYTRNTFGAIIMIVLFCLAPTLGLVVGLRIVFLAYTFFIAWNIPGIVTMIYLLSTCRKDLRAGFNRQIVKNIFVVTSLGACTLDVEDPTVLKNVIDFEDVCAGSAEVCELYVAPAEPVPAPAPAPAAANPAPAAAPADPNAAPAAADPNAPAADPNAAAADANAAPAADANAAPAADANAAPAAVQDAPAVVTIPADPTKLTSVRVRKTDGSYVYVCHDVMYAKECVDAINIALTLRDRSRLVTVDLVLDSLQQQTVQLPALAVERIMSFLPALDEMWTRKKNELRAHGGKTEITNAQGEIVWRFDTHVEEAIPYTPSLPNYSAAAAAAVESPEYARASSSINEKGRRDEDITYIVPEMDYTTMMSPVPASPALVTLMPHLDAMMHSPDIRFRSSPALRRGITNRD